MIVNDCSGRIITVIVALASRVHSIGMLLQQLYTATAAATATATITSTATTSATTQNVEH